MSGLLSPELSPGFWSVNLTPERFGLATLAVGRYRLKAPDIAALSSQI